MRRHEDAALPDVRPVVERRRADGRIRTPPGDDADGDGVNGGTAGGDDCNDNDNTVYPGALESCDALDNDCNDLVDDACVEDLPFSHRVDFPCINATTGFEANESYAIYQAFDSLKPLDLDQRTVTFSPNAEATQYTVTTGPLDWDSDLGEIVPVTSDGDASSCDDCFTNVPLEFPFPFYGADYTTVFPSSNGYLTFGVGDRTYSESVQTFLANAPRIAAFWDDLDTSGPTGTIEDEVHYFSSGSKLVVTYQNIQIYPTSGTTNTFQFVLTDDGTIKISYDGMTDVDESSLVGITPGSLGGGIECTAPLTDCFGTCVDIETNPDHCGACGNVCTSDLLLGRSMRGRRHVRRVECSVYGQLRRYLHDARRGRGLRRRVQRYLRRHLRPPRHGERLLRKV